MPVEIGRPRPTAVIQRQIEAVSTVLETSIAQPSTAKEVLTLSPVQIRERFPVREAIYRDVFSIARQHGSLSPEKQRRYSDKIRLLNNLDAYISQNKMSEDDRVLRDNQMTAFEALRDKMERGEVTDRGYFQFPTGWGKTVLFSEVVKATNVKTLIVVPTLFTGTQAADTLSDSSDAVDLGRVFGGDRELHRQVTITTYASLANDMKKGLIKPEDYGLLILDEAHLALTKQRKGMVEQFTNALKLGFTATPKYSDKKQVSDLLPPLIQKETVKDAVRDGLLAPLTSYEVPVDMDLSGVTITGDDYNERELGIAVNKKGLNQAAVDIYQRKRFFGQPAVAYCAGVAHAEALAAEFNKKGIAAEVVSGKQTPKQQREAKRRLRDGEIKVLCNADILTVGFDEPKVSVCLNLRPTLSRVMAEQRGGRVLRLDPNNPDKHAYIIDFIPSDPHLSQDPIRYADVIEGRGLGLTTWHYGLHKEWESRPAIEVEGVAVRFEMLELLSVFDELMRTDTLKTKYTISVGALQVLLGKGKDAITLRLPQYMRGNPKIIKEALRDPLEALGSPDSDEREITLPTDAIERMLLDTIYQRMYGQDIAYAIPGFVEKISTSLNRAIKSSTILEGEVANLQTLGKLAKQYREDPTMDITQLVESFIYGLDRLESVCEQVRRSPGTQRIHDSLQQTKQLVTRYKEDEVTVIRKRRLRTLLKKKAKSVMDVVTAGYTYEGSELAGKMEDLRDRDKVTATINTAVSRFFMDNSTPSNVITIIKRLSGISQLPAGRELGDGLQQVKRIEGFVSMITEGYTKMGELRGSDVSIQVYERANEAIEKIFRAVTNVLDLSQNTQFAAKLTQTETQELTTLRERLGRHLNNTRVARNEVREAVALRPELMKEFEITATTGGHIQRTALVTRIQRNSQFIHEVWKLPHLLAYFS